MVHLNWIMSVCCFYLFDFGVHFFICIYCYMRHPIWASDTASRVATYLKIPCLNSSIDFDPLIRINHIGWHSYFNYQEIFNLFNFINILHHMLVWYQLAVGWGPDTCYQLDLSVVSKFYLFSQDCSFGLFKLDWYS